MSDDLDPSSLLGDPTAQEQAAAYAAALRKQQYDSGLLHVFGNKGLSDLGSSMSGQAQNALGDLRARDQSQGALLMKSIGLGRKKLINLKNGKSVSYDPLTGETEELADGLGAAAQKVARSGDGSLNAIDMSDPSAPKVTQLTKSVPHAGRGGGQGGTSSMSPAAIEQMAREYEDGTFKLSTLGRDSATRTAVINRHADLFPASQRAVNTAGQGADSKSLGHLQQQADAVNSFTRTFDKNVAMLQEAAAKLNSSNSPFLNKGLRWFQSNVEGDPNLSAFKLALNTVTSEAGKINSGSTGSSGVPISVLAEMEHNLPPNATPEQIVAALGILRRDSENRRSAYNEQLGEIRGRIGGHGSAPQQAAPGGAPAGALTPEQQARLAELRAKRAAGALK